MKIKKLLSVFIAGTMAVTAFTGAAPSIFPDISGSITASAEEETAPTSGTFGDDLTWVIDDEGTLTISGSGYLTNEYFRGRDDIKNVVISDGVIGIGDYAFAGCLGLESVTVGNGLTYIGEYAFDGTPFYKNLKSENGIKYLGDLAYKADNNIITAEIKEGTKRIADRAFSECLKLTSVTIPDSVEFIGDGAFEGCTGLESIIIPDSVTNIDSHAFSGCSALKSINIPDSITSIGYSVFEGCSSLESITIPDSVTNIDSYAFMGCSALTSIAIPEGVTSINYEVFKDCSSLKSVIIPDSVEIIWVKAFEGCLGLESINIPKSVTRIDDGAFEGCTGLENIYVSPESQAYSDIDGVLFDKGITHIVLFPRGRQGDLTIPDSVNDINIELFSGCKQLRNIYVSSGNKKFSDVNGVLFNKDKTELLFYPFGRQDKEYTIPEGVTSLADHAFKGCSVIKSVTFPASVKSIGDHVFEDCPKFDEVHISDLSAWCNADLASRVMSNAGRFYVNGELLTDLVIPDDINEIKQFAFAGCLSIKTASIHDGVTSIGGRAFNLCTNLTSAVIPDSVTYIGVKAFIGCTKLTSINIPDSVTKIDEFAFYNCYALKSIDIPGSVKSIGDHAFYDCNKLESLTLGEGIESIGIEAFKGCKSITSLVIPDSVKSVGDHAFSVCSGIKSLTIGNGITYIVSDQFSECSSLESAVIPASVTVIEEDAFQDCTSLKSVTIPDSVTSIHRTAFQRCTSLTSITIPASVESIAFWAFDGCEKLESIYIMNPKCGISMGEIFGISLAAIPNTVTIYGYTNSTAQLYAENNKNAFVSLDIDPAEVTPTVAEDGTVSWTPAQNADHYRVAKYENGKTYYGAAVTDTSYKLKNIPTTDYIVSIITFDKDGSKTVGKKVKIKVDDPFGYVNKVTVDEDGVVSWKGAENAAAYRVVKIVNGKSYYAPKVTDTSYKLVAVPKKDYQIYVIAYGEDGRISRGNKNLIEVGDIGAVFDTKVDKSGKVTWSAVRGAAYYRVGRITDGKTYVGPKTEDTSYQLAVLPKTDYKVYVVAFDNEGGKTAGAIVNVERTREPIVLRNIEGDNSSYVFTYGGEEFSAVYTHDNWHITDSYRITDKNDITDICKALADTHPIHNKKRDGYRTAEDMAYEWEQHNIVYDMLPDSSEWKSNVKDVDLDPDDQGKSYIEMAMDRLNQGNE